MVTWAIKNYTSISLKTIIHAQPLIVYLHSSRISMKASVNHSSHVPVHSFYSNQELHLTANSLKQSDSWFYASRSANVRRWTLLYQTQLNLLWHAFSAITETTFHFPWELKVLGFNCNSIQFIITLINTPLVLHVTYREKKNSICYLFHEQQ